MLTYGTPSADEVGRVMEQSRRTFAMGSPAPTVPAGAPIAELPKPEYMTPETTMVREDAGGTSLPNDRGLKGAGHPFSSAVEPRTSPRGPEAETLKMKAGY